jgi:tetratricopeptide (TPR) repeat protein
MSYINNALRKLQKEEKTRYMAYDNIVLAPVKKPESSQKWLSIIGILMVFFFAAGMVVYFYGQEDKTEPVIPRIIEPPLATTVIEEPKTVKKVEVRQRITTPKVLTAQRIAESKALFAQALQKQREGKLEDAKILYRKVVGIDSHNIQAFNNLGVIYMGEKNYRRAIIRFNNALDVKHDYVDAHYNLACLFAQKNDVPQSLFYLKNAIEFNPEVRKWAKDDGDLKVLTNLPEFKKLMEKQYN